MDVQIYLTLWKDWSASAHLDKLTTLSSKIGCRIVHTGILDWDLIFFICISVGTD